VSFMFEVYYRPPASSTREAILTERVRDLGGRLDFREEPRPEEAGAICLTFEFDDYSAANKAADELRRLGEHVEGPVSYGA
jgi:hypothetical protein